jgi:hypothetical protein
MGLRRRELEASPKVSFENSTETLKGLERITNIDNTDQ